MTTDVLFTPSLSEYRKYKTKKKENSKILIVVTILIFKEKHRTI